MSNPYRTERRTLGVKAGFQRPAWTYDARNPQPSQDRKPQQPAAQRHSSRPQTTERSQRAWGQPFEVRCLLIAGEPFRPETPRTLRCQHVRANGEVLGPVVAKWPHWATPPATGARVEVGATVTMSNGPGGVPLARLDVHRWSAK
ncbi:hypothetical protein [Cupriavidus sp. UYPR2.512]|uniref:hypothetical protein n=1 Tax=Cupriavidus sp. UYPR2.512 TaxID=1080187 RepID=UPI0003710952|nr:hypothetical protein [Cupriavidus sp. UYPR2.512]UIF85157.1 hypothetical protein KAF44_13420 [Cupriavidus necator]